MSDPTEMCIGCQKLFPRKDMVAPTSIVSGYRCKECAANLERAPDDVLGLIQEHGLSVSPRAGGGWMVCTGSFGAKTSGTTHAKTISHGVRLHVAAMNLERAPTAVAGRERKTYASVVDMVSEPTTQTEKESKP
jgi:hypothetical protein